MFEFYYRLRVLSKINITFMLYIYVNVRKASKLCCCIFQNIQLVQKFQKLKIRKERIVTEETFKICILLTHFRPIFPFCTSYFLMFRAIQSLFRTIQSLRSATMGGWMRGGDRDFVKNRYGKTGQVDFHSLQELRTLSFFIPF